MKKYYLVIILPLFFISCDKETILPETKVPAEITNYVDTHYPANPIIQVTKDNDGFKLTYDIVLQDFTKLEFNRKKEIIEIQSPNKLPDSVIPTKILEYVFKNYASNWIISWDLDDKRQKVELNNGLEIEFSTNGDFLRIDAD